MASVRVVPVKEIRPRLEDEFALGEFVPRTPAIAEAYRWGKELHKGQVRLNGEPYFETHCVWVASFLDRLIGREAWTIAGLLHDAVEDQGETLDAIRERFPGPLGEEVAYIVDGVTKISNPRDGRTREIETLRKLAQFRDPGVYLVKLADKSHNLLTLQYMPEHKRQQKALEVIRAYGKLAGILNCYRWRRWLEDLAFPYADPETFAYVKEKIDADPRLDLKFLNEMMAQLGTLMETSGISGSVELTVNGYYQTWQKLRRMARARRASMDSFVAVNDLVSFRLVVDSNEESDCYALLPKVNRFLGPYLDQNRFDDYIACPQNGYRALQVTAWLPDLGAIEVAIATRDMEGENHWGVVYALKQGKDISKYRPIEIFTPSGSARFLPEGSTVLDAVASIQQEFLLDKISAVKVNGNLARLSDHIQPGDIVEVITGATRLAPTEEWLAFSNPSTARLLRSVLVTEALKRSAEKGRQIARQLLKDRGLLALEDVQALEPTRIDNLLEQLACASLEDFYAALGSGAIRLQEVSQTLDRVGITNEVLPWTTIQLLGSARANRPGVLARLAGLVSQYGGNILRSVNNTLPEGGFSLRLVVNHLNPNDREALRKAYASCGVELEQIEIT